MTSATLADSTGILEVFRLLARQRSVVTYSGSEFRTVLSRLAFLEQQVLMELVQTGQPPGYLLTQRGWGVFAQQGVLTGQPAAEQMAAGAARSTLRLFALGAAPAALAFASVEAAPGTPIPGDEDDSSLSARLSRLSQRRFSGVLAARVRERVNIWQMQAGKVTAQQELLRPETFGPFVELPWKDHDLPRLRLGTGDSDAGDLDAGDSDAGDAQPEGRAGLLTTTRPADPGASQPSQSHSSQSQPSQGAGGKAQNDAGNADLVWNHFRRVLDAHLGEASLRLYSVVRAQHAYMGGSTLCDALGLHVERVAGRSAGLEFRRHVTPLLTSLAPVLTSLEGSHE